MVEKMPGIAIEALEQFHSMDRALRKKYYYLNYLEKMSATDDGENSEGSAKTALEVNINYHKFKNCLAIGLNIAGCGQIRIQVLGP